MKDTLGIHSRVRSLKHFDKDFHSDHKKLNKIFRKNKMSVRLKE